MFKKTAIVAGLGLALSATAQADYNFEAGAAITGGDVDSIGVSGRYYIGGVDDSKGPYGQAEFLDHASSVGIDYIDGELDGAAGLETEAYSIDGRYVTEGSGWIFEAGYDYTEFDPGNAEIDTFNLGFGKYLTDTTTLTLGYESSDAENAPEIESYRIDLEHMFNWEDSGLKLHASYGFIDLDDDEELSGNDDIDAWEIDAIWYPCKNFGIGAAYSNTEYQGEELEEYGVLGEYFITQSVAVTVAYLEGEIEDTNVETDSFVVGVTARF
ncbi:MAG: hypothetical protein Hals2KO_26850 [Halioglobus sp.]